MNIFDLFEKELECDMAYVESVIANAKCEILGDQESFMEAGGSSNVFQKLIAKVKEIVTKAIDTIRQFFASKQIELGMKKAEAAAKENPGRLKQKVKVKDYEKLNKLNKKAKEDLKKCKTKAQVDDVMEKYRKQRNIAISAGAVTVVTLGACFAYSKKKGKANEAALNKKLGETQAQIKSLEQDVLSRKDDELAAARAEIELLKDAAKDSVDQNRELAFKWMKFGAAVEKYYQGIDESYKIYEKRTEGISQHRHPDNFPSAEEYKQSIDKVEALEDRLRDRFNRIKGSVGLDQANLNLR